MNEREIIRAMKIFAQELHQLQDKHDVNLVLSPDNLLVDEGVVSLKDTAPQSDIARAYPFFSAPEVTKGKATSASAVYFLGATMYMMLTGIPPQDARSRISKENLLQKEDAFSDMVNKAMALEISDRFTDLNDLIQALEKLENEKEEDLSQADDNQEQAEEQAEEQDTKKEDLEAEQPDESTDEEAPVETNTEEKNPESQMEPQNEDVSVALPEDKISKKSDEESDANEAAKSENAEENPLKSEIKGEKLLKTALVVATGVLIAVVGGLLIWAEIQKENAQDAFVGEDYPQLVSIVENTLWIEDDLAWQYDYSKAWMLLQEEKHDEALEILQSLSGYTASNDLVQATCYDLAMDMMEHGELSESLEVLEYLEDYKESEYYIECLNKYMMAESTQDKHEQYITYTSLESFLDSEELAAGLADELYSEEYDMAMSMYMSSNAAHIIASIDLFANLPVEYKSSDKYAKAAQAYEQGVASLEDAQNTLNTLRELQNEIWIEPLVMSDEYIRLFLSGKWESADGGGTMEWIFDSRGSAYHFEGLQQRISGEYSVQDRQLISENGYEDVDVVFITMDEVILRLSESEEYIFKRVN